MQNLQQLVARWYSAKAAEREVAAKRREIEDEISTIMLAREDMTSINEKVGQYKLKISVRMNRKIDADKLQELAKEHGLAEHLSSLFRWKPEINSKQWEAADDSITRPLLGAITTKPGRASYAVELIDDKGE